MEYRIEVSQAMADLGKNEFRVIIGDKGFKAEAQDTGDWETYRANSIEETIKLDANKTYALTIRSHDIVQPRMMNFKGVRFHKK